MVVSQGLLLPSTLVWTLLFSFSFRFWVMVVTLPFVLSSLYPHISSICKRERHKVGKRASQQLMGINEQLITIIKWDSTQGRLLAYIYQLLISRSCLPDSCLSAGRKAAACDSPSSWILAIISKALLCLCGVCGFCCFVLGY